MASCSWVTVEDDVRTVKSSVINSRDNDLGVNPTKGKKLDNMRASGKDETIALVPPVRFTLEQALEFVQEDELCEVTPKSIRLRKKILDESERTRAAKKAKAISHLA